MKGGIGVGLRIRGGEKSGDSKGKNLVGSVNHRSLKENTIGELGQRGGEMGHESMPHYEQNI